jgi:hypothetical protein
LHHQTREVVLIVNPFTGVKQFLPGYRKPGFKYASALSIVVPASEKRPAYFVIGGMPLKITHDLECNLTINGPGGIATGCTLAVGKVYYLYAILSGGEVKLVADDQDPETGPRDSGTWTYLGGFISDDTYTLSPFRFSNGIMLIDNINSNTDITTNNALPATAKTFLVPTTAKAIYLRGSWVAAAAIGDYFYASATSASVVARDRARIASAFAGIFFFWIELLTEQTVYSSVTNAATDSVTLRVLGWVEEPSEYA